MNVTLSLLDDDDDDDDDGGGGSGSDRDGAVAAGAVVEKPWRFGCGEVAAATAAVAIAPSSRFT